jgi:hypothetical protein
VTKAINGHAILCLDCSAIITAVLLLLGPGLQGGKGPAGHDDASNVPGQPVSICQGSRHVNHRTKARKSLAVIAELLQRVRGSSE